MGIQLNLCKNLSGSSLFIWRTKKKISTLFTARDLENSWVILESDYDIYYRDYTGPRMHRSELSFHSDVRLLGYLLEILGNRVVGDNLEIGVWKGKSLAYIENHSHSGISVGVDVCAFQFQSDELLYFKKKFFPRAVLVCLSSEKAESEVEKYSGAFKLIHIDGSHQYYDVRQDFMRWSKKLVPGGFLVFDDFNDPSSPDVHKAVNDLCDEGMFDSYHILGVFQQFPNSFVLSKK